LDIETLKHLSQGVTELLTVITCVINHIHFGNKK